VNKIFGTIAILILTAATYCTFSNTWPAPEVNQWQAKMMGDTKYFPALTIFIMALPPLFVLLIIKKMVLRLSKK
jgi:hypothetical protein